MDAVKTVAKEFKSIWYPFAKWTLQDYVNANAKSKKEWEELTNILLKEIDVKTGLKQKLLLTGSCASNLAYPPPYGDWDCAFVAPLKDLEEVQKKFAETYSSEPENKGCKEPRIGTLFEKASFPMGFHFRTKLGLPWIPVITSDNIGQKVKLDLTFRTPEQHVVFQEQTKNGIAESLPTDESKLTYIRHQHAAAILKTESTSQEEKQKWEKIYGEKKGFLLPKEIPIAK